MKEFIVVVHIIFTLMLLFCHNCCLVYITAVILTVQCSLLYNYSTVLVPVPLTINIYSTVLVLVPLNISTSSSILIKIQGTSTKVLEGTGTTLVGNTSIRLTNKITSNNCVYRSLHIMSQYEEIE